MPLPGQNEAGLSDPDTPGSPTAGGVSVVIPAYNYAKFLANAVDSVLRQTFTNFEVIVVDDGSTDDTRAVMARCQDRRLRYIYQENTGLSGARNTGIRHAGFDFVAFLDADDEWAPEMLETVMRTFAALPPEYGMVAGGCTNIDFEGNRIEDRKAQICKDREFLAKDFIMRNPAPLSSSVVIRKRVFGECGMFDPALRSSEDRDMWIRIASRYRVHYLCRPVVRVRKHRQSMSNHATRMRANTLKTIGKAYRNRVVSSVNIAFWFRVLSVYCFETAWTHYNERRRGEALLYAAAAFLTWPFPMDAAAINEPSFFRLRALVYFLTGGTHQRICHELFSAKPGQPGQSNESVADRDVKTSGMKVLPCAESNGVSIVIPAFNYAQYLGKAIDSALGQTHPHVEVVVIDDGSTDGTADLVKSYGSRVRYIYQNNSGLSAARNAGIKAARHPFVVFLDADDVLLPEMVETIMRCFAELPAGFGMVASASIKQLRIDAGGGMVENAESPAIHDNHRELSASDILLKNRFLPASAVIKKSVFERCGEFDTTLRSSEDRDMWIRVGRQFRIYLLDTPLVCIRKHPANMSKNSDRMRSNMQKVIQKAFGDRVVHPLNIPFKLMVYSIYYFENAWMCHDENRRPEAIRLMLLSLLTWPVFAAPGRFSEPLFFRIRALYRFFAT